MKDYRDRYYVAGTSALKPDCSRYSNENERIIDFPGEESSRGQRVDYGKIAHARHTRAQDRIGARCRQRVDESVTMTDFRSGSLKGTSFGGMKLWKMCVAGGIYSAMAIAALYVASV